MGKGDAKVGGGEFRVEWVEMMKRGGDPQDDLVGEGEVP